jgi:stage II sporulation protein R
MNTRFFKAAVISFLAAVLLSFFGFGTNCKAIEEKVVRLHILANSDSEYDQRIKMEVRDSVFAYSQLLIGEADSPESSEAILEEHLDEIEDVANKRLEELGADYTAQAEVVKDYFSTREYETFTLPAGEYTALRVNLGEGIGHNWWCALYPTVCVSSSAEFTGFTQEETQIVTNPEEYRVSFKLYEWYRAFLNLFQ